MITLADEILAVLPRYPLGLYVRDAAVYLAADYPSVRQAYLQLEGEGRARILLRKRRAMYLVSNDYERGRWRICVMCKTEFERARKSKRVTCSRACCAAYGWRDPVKKAKRMAALSAAQSTPEALARTAAHNRRRWSKPEEHTKLSEQNRRQWRDPLARAKRSNSIQMVNSSPEKRAKHSAIRKRQWQTPEFREKTVAGIRRSKGTPEARAKFSKLLRERWQDPVWRAKYMASARVQARKNADRARGKKQSPEHIAKRMDGRRKGRRDAQTCGEAQPD